MVESSASLKFTGSEIHANTLLAQVLSVPFLRQWRSLYRSKRMKLTSLVYLGVLKRHDFM